MKIPAVQPITAAQSRASRFQLGLTQADVISQSGLPGHKLKQFESGRFVPDMPFLQKLADFYTEKGVDLSEAVVSDPPAPAPAPAPAVKPGADKVRPAPLHRPHFYVAETVTPELLDACLERMHGNDERVNEILGKDLRAGLLSAFHEQTVNEQNEVFGALAENYLIFRLLQGSPLVKPVDAKVSAKTHAELLGQYYAKSPVSLLAEIDKTADELVEAVSK
jgi:transcriptional regulator with XRE-family HTH domain